MCGGVEDFMAESAVDNDKKPRNPKIVPRYTKLNVSIPRIIAGVIKKLPKLLRLLSVFHVITAGRVCGKMCNFST